MGLEHLIRDVRYACRGLARDRAFTATTVATLAVALALMTVVFTIFNAYVLRPYAVRDPYSLYEIRWRARDAGGRAFRWQDYEELRGRRDLFESVIAERHRLADADGTLVVTAFVSGNYFEALGGGIELGRALQPLDARAPGDSPVAVLSDQAWTRLFDRDPSALGRDIRLNGARFTIVGIMRPGFSGVNDTPPDVWVPVTMHAAIVKQDLFGANQPRELAVIVRLRAGVSPEQVQAALTPFMARVVERSTSANASGNENENVRPEILSQATPAPLTLELLALLSPVFAAFLLVLVAACANVSNIMLARANARQREMGVRLSLGASRARVVQQLLTEGLLLALAAGAVALVLASLLLRVGVRFFFLSLPPTFAAQTRILPLDLDTRVFLFTLIAAAMTTVMFALLPALQATRVSLTHALRGDISAVVRRSRLRSVLVAGQVAVSLVLLLLAATLTRNSMAVAETDLGFDPRGLVSITQKIQGKSLIEEAAATLRRDANVGQLAVTSDTLLMGDAPKTPMRTLDSPALVAASYLYVSPEYFSLAPTRILRGRDFQTDEANAEARVAIVSASAARALWPTTDPLGRTVRVWIDDQARDLTVIGVADDMMTGLVYRGKEFPHLYLPTNPGRPHAAAILARGRATGDLTPTVLQRVFATLHSNPLAFEAVTLDEALAAQTFPLRIASWIGMLLSGIALVLSVSGLYGVVAYALTQRRREIGIRMALGATSAAVVRLLMHESARLVVVGGSLGLLVAIAALMVLRSLVRLDKISFLDAPAFFTSIAAVAIAAAVATFIPARRAAAIAPSDTLRSDG